MLSTRELAELAGLKSTNLAHLCAALNIVPRRKIISGRVHNFYTAEHVRAVENRRPRGRPKTPPKNK